MNVNRAILVGRVTRDIELRTTQSGNSVCGFSIATNNYWTDKSGQKQEKTEFHNIVLWGKLAEVAAQYLVKGQEVYISGAMQTRKYTGKDGVERSVTEIVGEEMQFGQRPKGYNNEAPTQQPNSRPAQQPQNEINPDDGKEIRIEDVPF